MNIILEFRDSKSGPTAASLANDSDEMTVAEKVFSTYVEKAKLTSSEDNVSDIETSDIATHNLMQQTPAPQPKDGELLTGLLGAAKSPSPIDMPAGLDLPALEVLRFPDVTSALTPAENGWQVNPNISGKTTVKIGTNTLEEINASPKEHIRGTPTQMPAFTDSSLISTPAITNAISQHINELTSQTPREDTTIRTNEVAPSGDALIQPSKPTSYLAVQDITSDKATLDMSAFKESLPKTPVDVVIEIEPNTKAPTELVKAATSDSILTLQTLAAQDVAPNKAKAVQIPMQSLGLDIKDRPGVNTDKAALKISALKESLPKAPTDAAIEIKPNNQLVTEITKTATEPPTLLGAVTTSTVGTSTRIPQSLNVATPLPTSHPAIQAVAQNLVKVQETQSGITVRLDPPQMGRVFIDFQFDADRNVTAIIRSEVPETSFALKDKAEFFQQILKENGFNTVTLNFEQNDTSKQDIFDQNSNAPIYFGFDTEPEEVAEVLPPVTRYELSSETAIDIKL